MNVSPIANRISTFSLAGKRDFVYVTIAVTRMLARMPLEALANPPPRAIDTVRDLLGPATVMARIGLTVTRGVILVLLAIPLISGLTGHNLPLALGGSIGALLGGALFIYLPVWLFVSPSIRNLRRALVDGVQQAATVAEVAQLQGRTPRWRFTFELRGEDGQPRRVRVESLRGASIAVGDTVEAWTAPGHPKAVAVAIPGAGVLQGY
jgi:hypothetical protein